MLPESKRYYREPKSSGSNRSNRRSDGRTRSSRVPNSGKKTKNPASFELLGIGLAAGLCLGFVLGFSFRNMGETGAVLPESASKSSAGEHPQGSSNTGTVTKSTVAERTTEEERKRQQIATQQAILDWEKDTFDLKDSNRSASGYKNKALSIIDGLDETLEEEEAKKARPVLPSTPYIRTD